jgi:hypothetical protein
MRIFPACSSSKYRTAASASAIEYPSFDEVTRDSSAEKPPSLMSWPEIQATFLMTRVCA